MHLVLFDVDGTLVDSQRMILAAMDRAFAAHDLSPPSREATLAIVGLSIIEAIETLAADRPGAPVAAIAAAYKDAYHALRLSHDHHEPLYEGAREAILALHERDDLVLGLVTGKSRRGARAVIERFGLDHCFATVQTADDHPSKPHPAMVRAALSETGFAPERALVVGDSIYDMAMARAAGVAAIGVSWGYGREAALREAGALAVAADWDDLTNTIARTCGRDPR